MNPDNARINGPDVTVDVSIPYAAWSALRDFSPIGAANAAIREALACADLPGELPSRKLEVSVVLANDDLLRTLNREYRGKDKPTNVLSFPQFESFESADMPGGQEEAVCLGDILLAFETVQSEAKEKSVPFSDYALHLLVHGTLHLIGFDHEEDAEAEQMQDLEIKVMNNLGVKNPYDLSE